MTRVSYIKGICTMIGYVVEGLGTLTCQARIFMRECMHSAPRTLFYNALCMVTRAKSSSLTIKQETVDLISGNCFCDFVTGPIFIEWFMGRILTY